MSATSRAGRHRVITLLTDFGTRDGYAAAMHGVMLGIAPAARVVDVSHDIEPGDVAAAAHCLERYWLHYPPGTIHVVVVDPGVGSARAALVVEAAQRLLVGPDNGVLSPALRLPGREIHTIENAAYQRDIVSTTFHGRDVFAPAAAHLALGVAPTELGSRRADAIVLPAAIAELREGVWYGVVVGVDRFGNLTTNIDAAALPPAARVLIAERHEARLRRTYAEAPPDGLLALSDSDGRVEIAVNGGSAAERLAVGIGAIVQVFIRPPS